MAAPAVWLKDNKCSSIHGVAGVLGSSSECINLSKFFVAVVASESSEAWLLASRVSCEKKFLSKPLAIPGGLSGDGAADTEYGI